MYFAANVRLSLREKKCIRQQKLTQLMPLFFISPLANRIYSLRRHKASFGKQNNGLTECIGRKRLQIHTHTHTYIQTNNFRIVTFMRVANYALVKWHSLVYSFTLFHLFHFVRASLFVCVQACLPFVLSMCEHHFGEHIVFSIHSCLCES